MVVKLEELLGAGNWQFESVRCSKRTMIVARLPREISRGHC